MIGDQKCRYCGMKFSTSKLAEHYRYDHSRQIEGNKKRVKIGLIGALVGISIVIGMIWGLLI